MSNMEKPLLVDQLFGERAPGVYRYEDFAERPSEFSTGVPVFIGTVPNAREDAVNQPPRLHFWPQFQERVLKNAREASDCLLAYAVRGFFQNDGRHCYV